MRFLLPLILAAAPLHAESYVADAFGIVPVTAMAGARAEWSGLRQTRMGESVTAPGTTETVLMFLGPKSVVAGKEDAHAVAIALDRHGNLARDGIEPVFTLAGRAEAGWSTMHGITDLLFRPEPRAGSFEGAAEVEGRQSSRAIYRVTADLASVAPRVARGAGQVAPEMVAAFETDEMRDRFGNRVEDGISAPMTLRHADGRHSILPATARGGVAEAVFLTRDVTGAAGLVAGLATEVSAPAPVSVAPLEIAGETRVTLSPLPEIDALRLVAGPVLTGAGHLLNDGVPVAITLTDATGRTERQSLWLRDGHVSAIFALSPEAGPWEVRIDSAHGEQSREVALSAGETGPRAVE